jgi:hypothetical protein
MGVYVVCYMVGRCLQICDPPAVQPSGNRLIRPGGDDTRAELSIVQCTT